MCEKVADPPFAVCLVFLVYFVAFTVTEDRRNPQTSRKPRQLLGGANARIEITASHATFARRVYAACSCSCVGLSCWVGGVDYLLSSPFFKKYIPAPQARVR